MMVLNEESGITKAIIVHPEGLMNVRFHINVYSSCGDILFKTNVILKVVLEEKSGSSESFGLAVVLKWEFRRQSFSIYRSVYVPVVTCGCELWVVIKGSG